MNKALHVYWNESKVGLLSQDVSGRLNYTYDVTWLTREEACALSLSLPLKERVYEEKACRPFFAGLLPEGGVREELARSLKISVRNDFALLRAIGGDCAGAVSFFAEDVRPPSRENWSYKTLKEGEVFELLSTLPRAPFLSHTPQVRLSLAGAQQKLPLFYAFSTFAIPENGAPSTHILKPAIVSIPGSVENEAFCMTLAKRVGLPVPNVEIFFHETLSFLLITRYDRETSDEREVLRLHQEDFCQALGIPPENKYQNEGGPSLKDCLALLSNNSLVPALDVQAFLKGVIFNYVIGNADAHGKNFSLLYGKKGVRLAPFYDLLSTEIYDFLSPKHAMKIGRVYKAEALFERHWQTFAEEGKMGWPFMRRLLLETAQKITEATKEVQNFLFPDHTPEVVQKICTLIQKRVERIHTMLE